jgi:RsmE family RNA methyltransferase
VNLILLDGGDRLDGDRVTLTGARAKHLRDVLRVWPDQQVRIGLLDGPLGFGVVQAVNGDAVTLRCAFEATAPNRPDVDLLLAVPRPKVLRRLWAPLASLGVGQIILTNAERVERPYFDSHILDERVFGPLLREGLQQARDTRLPRVSIHRRFKVLVEDDLDTLAGPGLRLVADPSGETSIGAAVSASAPQRILLAVGPEGGWNPYELSLLQAHAFQLVGLGPRPLRVDTACTALLAIVHEAARTAWHGSAPGVDPRPDRLGG